MATMYDKLLLLPLFQGLTLKEFTDILGKVKFRFDYHKAGKTLFKVGEPCKRITFIIDGQVEKLTTSNSERFQVTEFPEAPYLVELSSFFGLSTNFKSTYKALTDVCTLSFHKRYLQDEMSKYHVFEMNYKNMLSARVQSLNNMLWDEPCRDPESRIRHFLLSHMEKPTGRKVFKMAGSTLALYTNDSIPKTNAALEALQEKGILTYDKKYIIIEDASLLLTE